MGLVDWAQESAHRYRRHSPGYATKRSAQELLKGLLRRVPNPEGDLIWEREWDVLVVLDACRFDAFEQRYGNADWLSSLDCMSSVGSASPEWMDKTFADDYSTVLSETAYITGNPYSETHVPRGLLTHLDEVWRDSWDEDVGTIRPEVLTNRAVKHHRRASPERMVVHYMQPHWPYVTDQVMYGFDPSDITDEYSTSNPFDRQNKGDLNRAEHFERYLSNLDYVVDHLRNTLLRAIDADTVVLTADHATLFGEYGLYKHPKNMPLRGLRQVPWAETTATDDDTYDPDEVDVGSPTADTDRDQQLRDLGYLS